MGSFSHPPAVGQLPRGNYVSCVSNRSCRPPTTAKVQRPGDSLAVDSSLEPDGLARAGPFRGPQT
eukprot:4077355-Lingulodinium_polyedra.AAC.1